MRGYCGIGLVNSKSDCNVGGVLRAAGCFEASFVAIQGSRVRKYSSDTQKWGLHHPLFHTDDILQIIPHDCVPIAVEISDNAKPLEKYIHPMRGFYIFGPEDGSIPKAISDKCRDVLAVPSKFCLNLAACVNVVMYDRVAKMRLRCF